MVTIDPAGTPSLWDLVARRAALTPDAPMLLDTSDRSVSFGEFAARAERTAAGLHSLGVGAGTRVTWQLPTRVETVVLSMALARLGAVQNPIIPIYRDREVGFALRQTDAEFFLTPGEWRGFDFTAMAGRLDTSARVIEAYGSLPEGDPATLPDSPDAPESPGGAPEIRWIYYTSGTTSDPKGVSHTDGSLIAGGACLADALGMRPTDVGSIAFPYAHIGGPDYLVMLLLHGFPALLLEQFALPDALAEYRRHGVTMAGGSTAFYAAFLAEQRGLDARSPGAKLIPTLRLLSGGGAPKPPELYHEVVRELGCELAHGYGMTEAPMITMGSPGDTTEQLAHTEGRPPASMEIRITGLDGEPAPTGREGEVRLRGAAVCRGYTDPDMTAEAFDEDGFFRTGDLGYLREDGHLVLTGRLKDIIIRKGENISAKEIEELLYRHPDVGDAAVIGLPDPARGERVCAVIEQPHGATRLTLPAMAEYLRHEGLMLQKIPEQLEVVDELPRNETLHKILKHRLRERFS